jgi:sigma-B regulation protein RsbU (phosphoserine phosphatase)
MAVIESSQLIRGTWPERLDSIVATMREMSLQTDPQAMVRDYGRRMSHLFESDRRISLSRRALGRPNVRITRYSLWDEHVNPWKQKDRLPVLHGGMLADLIYGDDPLIVDDVRVSAGDPAAEYLAGQRSLMAIPLYDQGVALNMVVLTREEPEAFNRENLPELVLISNLFGMATHNLVLADEVKSAYELVDHELRLVADIQRSLLPSGLPEIPNMKLAVHYETSRRAGGDYYDFFPLPDGRWGILLADVSGHGTPAAVMMAVTHSIAHGYGGPPSSPARMLSFINRRLAQEYTQENGHFVTAFYGVYNPATRELTYANAGHPPARLRRCGEGTVQLLDGASQFPLGVADDVEYGEQTHTLRPGDRILFFTDGVTEAQDAQGEMFSEARLDQVLARCRSEPQEVIDDLLRSLHDFTKDQPPQDDRTFLAANIY